MAGLGPSCAPPIHILYGNFHDAIRSELECVQADVRSLERASEGEVHSMLLGLRDRCRFLDQVHSYHSSVEDEVRPWRPCVVAGHTRMGHRGEREGKRGAPGLKPLAEAMILQHAMS